MGFGTDERKVEVQVLFQEGNDAISLLSFSATREESFVTSRGRSVCNFMIVLWASPASDGGGNRFQGFLTWCMVYGSALVKIGREQCK